MWTLKTTVLGRPTSKNTAIVPQDDDRDAIFSSLFLLLWELLPIFSVTFFFRHIPNLRWNMMPERGPLLGSSVTINHLGVSRVYELVLRSMIYPRHVREAV